MLLNSGSLPSAITQGGLSLPSSHAYDPVTAESSETDAASVPVTPGDTPRASGSARTYRAEPEEEPE